MILCKNQRILSIAVHIAISSYTYVVTYIATYIAVAKDFGFQTSAMVVGYSLGLTQCPDNKYS